MKYNIVDEVLNHKRAIGCLEERVRPPLIMCCFLENTCLDFTLASATYVLADSVILIIEDADSFFYHTTHKDININIKGLSVIIYWDNKYFVL